MDTGVAWLPFLFFTMLASMVSAFLPAILSDAARNRSHATIKAINLVTLRFSLL